MSAVERALELGNTLANIAADLLGGRKSEAEAIRDVLQAAVATGVPADVLGAYLTADAIRRTQLEVDIAEAVKLLAGKR